MTETFKKIILRYLLNDLKNQAIDHQEYSSTKNAIVSCCDYLLGNVEGRNG